MNKSKKAKERQVFWALEVLTIWKRQLAAKKKEEKAKK